MALFSRKKSKAKKAAKEEAAKSAADISTTTPAKQASSRGRKGPSPSQQPVHDVPVPAYPPREYNHNNGELLQGNGYLEETDLAGSDLHKHNRAQSQSCGDSGYGSAVQGSRVHSRSPSIHRFRQENEPLVHEEQVTPDVSIFHHQDHPVQDGRYQRQMQQRMPMRPSSVPPQALQSRSERVSRPPPPRSSSPGPVLQTTSTTHLTRSRSSAPSTMRQPSDWHAPVSPRYGPQVHSPSFQSRFPTSPMASSTQIGISNDESFSSLNMLCGLRVNRRGLILDEEGDPIAELYEGDIIDCVRQRADSYGNVLDEYGRVVGRVRTLPDAAQEPPILRPTTPGYNESRDFQQSFPAPPLPKASLSVDSSGAGSGQQRLAQQNSRSPTHDTVQKESYSSPTQAPASKHQGAIEHDERLVRTVDHPQDNDVPQYQGNEHGNVQREPHTLRRMASSVGHTESLPSVPESDSTAEIVLSDTSSHTSEGHRGSGSEDDSKSADEDARTKGQASSQQRHPKKAQHATVQTPKQITVSQEHSLSNEAAPTAQLAEDKLPRGVDTEGQVSKASPRPSLGRSTSERVPKPAATTPVPAASRKPALPSNNNVLTSVQGQSSGLHATPNRVKSPPLPSFPGRGFAGSLSGGNAMPGMPVRRLTNSGFPTAPAFGNTSMTLQPPPMKHRTSNSVPIVRSPLSSHGKCILYPVLLSGILLTYSLQRTLLLIQTEAVWREMPKPLLCSSMAFTPATLRLPPLVVQSHAKSSPTQVRPRPRRMLMLL